MIINLKVFLASIIEAEQFQCTVVKQSYDEL